MTKEAYFDMCEQMGSPVIEIEIPISLEDLPIEVEQAYHVYGILPDKLDSFNGVYYGKHLEYASQLMDLLDVSPKKEIFKVIIIIDALEREEVNRKKTNGR